MKYKTYKNSLNSTIIMRINEDDSRTMFSEDLANIDYLEYLDWVAEGNAPEPIDTTQQD